MGKGLADRQALHQPARSRSEDPGWTAGSWATRFSGPNQCRMARAATGRRARPRVLLARGPWWTRRVRGDSRRVGAGRVRRLSRRTIAGAPWQQRGHGRGRAAVAGGAWGPASGPDDGAVAQRPLRRRQAAVRQPRACDPAARRRERPSVEHRLEVQGPHRARGGVRRHGLGARSRAQVRRSRVPWSPMARTAAWLWAREQTCHYSSVEGSACFVSPPLAARPSGIGG